MPGWDRPGFAAAGWRPVQVLPHPDDAEEPCSSAQPNEPIRVVKELRPVKMTEPKPGVYVFDMGQNMVGWCRLKANAPAGTKITLRHAEMLNDDGTIYTANLRGAAQINEYTWRGGEAVLEPHFTYHGFRYVELTGLPSRPAEDAIVGRVFHSAAPDAGRFSCSNELINKIMHCVEWVQRAQHDERARPTARSGPSARAGWATSRPSRRRRFSTWTWPASSPSGCPTFAIRRPTTAAIPTWPRTSADPNQGFSGVPAWGDAGTVVPWRMYQNYADTRMLEQHFDSARRWIDFIHRHNPNLLWQKNRGNDYNDWLNGDTLVLQGLSPRHQRRARTKCLPRPFSPIPRRSWRRWPTYWGGRTMRPSMASCSRASRPLSTGHTLPPTAASGAIPRPATPWPCTSTSWTNRSARRPRST